MEPDNKKLEYYKKEKIKNKIQFLEETKSEIRRVEKIPYNMDTLNADAKIEILQELLKEFKYI